MTHVLVINEAVCSGCGRPTAQCECEIACANCGLPKSDCECNVFTPSVVKNEYGYGDDNFDEPEDEDNAMNLTEETPLGTPTLDFSKAPTANKQPAPTVRQQYQLVANDGEETPLGQPTWNFAPADICPDNSEPVGNDDHEQPMSNQTWSF